MTTADPDICNVPASMTQEKNPAAASAGSRGDSSAKPVAVEARPAVDLATMPAVELAAHLAASGKRLILVGVTLQGRKFRPSDWAERLAGVMASFRPGRPGRVVSHLGYSPLVVPSERGGDKCVIVDPRLRDLEPLAWAFVLNFARDNDLRTEAS